MRLPDSPYALLAECCPPASVDYCHELWHRHPFHLRLARVRHSKFGDYRYVNRAHFISINHDLYPYAFLLTYVHEVAHLHTFARYGWKITAHGKEWQRTFQRLMVPLLTPSVFPEHVLSPLMRYMQRPKASSCGDADLFQVLHPLDTETRARLVQLPEGETFQLNGRVFRRGELRRTRVICTELRNRKQYVIPGQAIVEKMKSD